MQRLRDLGIPLSVDDFGTGYSSLTYLKRLPIDQVKVDKSFVGSVGEPDSDDAAIVRAVVAMAAALKLRTVAEGVEVIEQLDALREVGCDFGQGFYFATPQPATHIQQLLDADRAAALFPPPQALLAKPELRVVHKDGA
jgi:EAL domain-containing protein (putative c-di-GMP-specific phosphodiesterase class I)